MKKIITLILISVITVASIVLIGFVGKEDKYSATIQFQEGFEEVRSEDVPGADKHVSEYMVEITGREGDMTTYGSGVIIGRSNDTNFVLTNKHVIEDLEKINCRYFNRWIFDAEVLYKSKNHDVAIISTKFCPETRVIGIDYTPFQIGDEIKQEGNLHGKGIISTYGNIVKTEAMSETGDYEHGEYVMADVYAEMGCSGGAITNIREELRGINFAIHTKKNLDFIIPVYEFADEIKEYIGEI